MSALTKDRLTKQRNGERVGDPVAAATVIWLGAMYALNASGYAVPAGTAGASAARGVAQGRADNAAGIAGAINVEGWRGTFQFANSAAADAIARQHIGQQCYVVDDQTVALTSAGGARQRAGRIVDVESTGVWVDVGEPVTEATLQTIDIELSAAQVLALNATPRTLLAAPGAGLAIDVVDYQVRKPAGVAYADIAAGDDIAIKYTDASGAVLATIEATGFLDQATAQTRIGRPTTTAAFTPVENAAIVAHMLTGEVTTGDSPLRFRIRYRTIALAI